MQVARNGSGADGNEQGFAGCNQRDFALFIFGKEFCPGEGLFPPGTYRGALRDEKAADGRPQAIHREMRCGDASHQCRGGESGVIPK